jgi:hypothetical protein
MSDLLLYAIELENRKVFLQVSPKIYQDYLFKECQIMFDFVKKNPPIKIIHTLELEDVLKVNYWVKYFMRHYGINNVRGGNYTDELLSEDTLRFLKRELESTYYDYEKEIDIFENVLTTYQSKDLDENEKDRLLMQSASYKSRQTLLSLIEIPENIIDHLEWIKEEIVNIKSIYNAPLDSGLNIKGGFSILSKLYSRIHITNTIEKDRYRIIMNNLKQLLNVYYSIKREQFYPYCVDSYLRNKFESFIENRIEAGVLIMNPNFTLDNFFFHPYVIMDWDSQMNTVNKLLDDWISMAYSILNWRDEIIFDLSTFHRDFEKKTYYALHLYEANNDSI